MKKEDKLPQGLTSCEYGRGIHKMPQLNLYYSSTSLGSDFFAFAFPIRSHFLSFHLGAIRIAEGRSSYFHVLFSP